MTSNENQPLSINTMPANETSFPDSPLNNAHAASPARRTQLKVALQLLQTAGHIIIVQGEPGMGKSDLLLRLRQEFPDTLHLGFIAATEQLELTDLLMALGATDNDVQLPAIDLLQTVLQEEMWPVLLIDDADRLNDDTLSALLSLWSAAQDADIPFSLVLAAPPGFSNRVTGTAHSQERLHHISLHPLSEQQTIDYLTQRLSSANLLLTKPPSSADMRALHIRAQGIPAKIDNELRQLLASPPPAQPAKAPERRTIILVSVAVLVLAGVLVTALRLADSPEKSLSQPEIIPLPASSTTPVQEMEPLIAESPPPSSLEADPALETPRPEIAPPTLPATTQTVQQDEESAKQDDATEAEPEIISAPAEEPPAPDPAIAASTPPLANDWLHNRSANAFTIQLVAAHNPDALKRFMDQHQLGDKAALLQIQREGRAWYVVVLGDYQNRADSRAALQRLPATMRKDGPWVRSFGELQQLARNPEGGSDAANPP